MIAKVIGSVIQDVKVLKVVVKRGPYIFLRFIVYGMVGVFSEVCQYTLVKIGRNIPLIEYAFRADWKVDEKLGLDNIWEVPWYTLYGQCSLWMFPVYGLCAILLIERIYILSIYYKINWVIRGVLYALAITVFELVAGFILWGITGYKIWYYSDSGNIMNMTSISLFLIWFITGMFVEFLYRELTDSSLRDKATEIYNIVAALEPNSDE